MATVVSITNPITGAVEQVDKLDHTAQQIDDAVALAPQLSNPNLLDNWYFGNPVNQRGQTSYTDEGNTIDRWKLILWQSTSPSLTISDGYITLSNNTAEGTPCSCNIQQIIDNPERFAGRIVTFSVLLGAVTKGSGKLLVSIMANGSTGRDTEIYTKHANSVVSVTFQLPTEITSLFVFIGASANNAGKGTFSIQLKAAKLELGTQQTLAHQDAGGNWALNEIPDYGEQLRQCQRYFQTFATESLRPTDALDFRPVMRANPALSTITIDGKTLYTAIADL